MIYLRQWMPVCLILFLAATPTILEAQTGTAVPSTRVAASTNSSANSPTGSHAPDWYPLPEEHARYLDQVLKYWEHRTSEIQRYRCRFKRWEYDVNWVGNPDVAKTFAEGVIKYAAPDKGLFHVEKASQVVLPLPNGQPPKYKPLDPTLNEHWVCDGKSLFEFDGRNRQLIQRELPPEMQGRQIVEGPLPFLFGAKAETIKQRYWVRVIVPPPKKNAFWLEAIPKTSDDAANFKMIHIIIAEEDFLPEGMVLYHRNQAKTTFSFEEREANWNDLIEKLNLFHREFFEPATPQGWKKVVDRYQAPSGGFTSTTVPDQARRPTRTQTR